MNRPYPKLYAHSQFTRVTAPKGPYLKPLLESLEVLGLARSTTVTPAVTKRSRHGSKVSDLMVSVVVHDSLAPHFAELRADCKRGTPLSWALRHLGVEPVTS